jgi:hypothetical protein
MDKLNKRRRKKICAVQQGLSKQNFVHRKMNNKVSDPSKTNFIQYRTLQEMCEL